MRVYAGNNIITFSEQLMNTTSIMKDMSEDSLFVTD
jgi:hypothetical protein